MTEIFAAIEQTPLSIWMREDFYAYFIALIFHSIGMALLVGGAVLVCLRYMGFAATARLDRFAGFFPVMWAGAALALLSGLALLVAYPAKALTNPVFGLKFAALAGATIILWRTARLSQSVQDRGSELSSSVRGLAFLALMLWLCVVVFGKLLLHTASVLMVS